MHTPEQFGMEVMDEKSAASTRFRNNKTLDFFVSNCRRELVLQKWIFDASELSSSLMSATIVYTFRILSTNSAYDLRIIQA